MDPNKPAPKTGVSGLKKPSAIPSIGGSRLPSRKSTGIPSAGGTASGIAKPTATAASRPITPTPNTEMPAPAVKPSTGTKTSASSGNLRTSLLPTSKQASNENLAPAASNEAVNKENLVNKSTIKDLTEKLETLKLKRAEDRDKLREYEKAKMQIQQLQDYKTKAQELMSELNKELSNSKQENKSIKESFQEYKEEMDGVEQRIEEMTVDKEIAEARCEELEDEIEKLKEKNEEIKLELDVLKGEIELNGVSGAASSFESKQLAGEIERLKGALIKLRDLSLQDKVEINGLSKQNEELNTKLKSITKESETLKAENSLHLGQINDLKDQVTATLGSVEMIEQLTEQNLDYEIKINELRETISDLEAINEVNDQLAESAHEEESEMRQNLDLAEMRIREFEKEIEFLKYKIADHEKTIVKFRELVQQMSTEKEDLGRKLQAKIDELQARIVAFAQTNQTQSPGNFDFKQKLIESKNFAKIIENEINKIEIQSLRKYNSYLTSFMSDQFMKRSGDHECILTMLFFKRLMNKSDLVMTQIKEKYSHLMSKSEGSSNLADKQEFVFEILMTIMHLKLQCNKYDHVLNTCSPKVYANIGSMYFDFQMHEKVLDLIIDFLQKDQLEENRKNMDMIEKASVHLETIYKNHLSEEKFDHLKFLKDLIVFGTFSCDSITVYLQYINSIVQVKDDQTEIMQLLKELSCNNEELKIFLKKASKHLPLEESAEKKIILCLPDDLMAQLEKSIDDFFKISKSLKELNYLASNSSEFVTNESTEGGLNAKKLEELAYQACDKVYLVDDNGPYENLRSSINELHETLKTTITGLEAGSYEQELNDEEYKIQKYLINSPVVLAADQFKNSLLEAESIKTKLESKEDEIKEIKRGLKLKVDELSEYKLRISLNESKAEATLKESEEKNKKLVQSIDEIKATYLKNEKQHTETLEAMQQEVDNYENEIKELKKKIPKKNPFANMPQVEALQRAMSPNNNSQIISPSAGNNFPDSSVYAQEIKMVKTMNKMLEKSNTELKANLAEALITKLPALPKLAKDAACLKKDEHLSKLSKQSNDLMKNLYSSLANVKVTELKPKVNESTDSNDMSYKTQDNLQFKFYRKSASKIQEQMEQLQRDLKVVKAEANVNSSQNIQKMISKKKCLAEIRLPCKEKDSKIIDLNIGMDEMRELLKHI